MPNTIPPMPGLAHTMNKEKERSNLLAIVQQSISSRIPEIILLPAKVLHYYLYP